MNRLQEGENGGGDRPVLVAGSFTVVGIDSVVGSWWTDGAFFVRRESGWVC